MSSGNTARKLTSEVQSSISTSNLKRTLGRKDLFAVAIGQIIGAGIMALTGIAIGMTGRSVNIAFMLAAIATLFVAIPFIFVTSSVRMRGGQYTWAAMFVGKKFAGMFMVIFIVSNISLAMYAMSFAEYFIALVPGIPVKMVSLAILTMVFVTNFFGVQGAAKLQQMMVLILAVSLALFTGYGIFQIQPGYFSQPGFLTSGIKGLLTAMALLTFATGGATVTLNLSAEAKNPKKDIPFVIVVSTLAVSAMYAFMATIAAGVLPINQVAYQPLTLVAEKILPAPLYVFFVVGGAMFALITTLNAQVAWVTKPVMQACVDNWFPQTFAKLHPKFNTPYVLLAIFYAIGVFPILTGFDIAMVANTALILNYIILIVQTFSVFKLPTMYKEQWEKSPYYVKKGTLSIALMITACVLLLQIVMLAMNLSRVELIGNVVVLVIAILFGMVRSSAANMESSIDTE